MTRDGVETGFLPYKTEYFIVVAVSHFKENYQLRFLKLYTGSIVGNALQYKLVTGVGSRVSRF